MYCTLKRKICFYTVWQNDIFILFSRKRRGLSAPDRGRA
jgi:hypothetical protein